MTDTYLPNINYAALIAALLNPPVCPFSGTVTSDQIKTILGEVGGIWPDVIRADMITDAVEQA